MYDMGKGWGFILLIIGIALIYFGITSGVSLNPFDYTGLISNYEYIIGILLALIGLGMIIFSRKKYPPYH